MRNNKTIPIIALVVTLTIALVWSVGCNQKVQPMGVTNLDSLHLVSSEGTATPILMVQSNGGSLPFQVNNANGTPVFYSDVDGNVTYNGFSSGGGNVNAPAAVNAPTAVGTATPALVVNSLGAGDVLLDVRKASTPVFSINNNGTWTDTGAATHTGLHTFNGAASVVGPTAAATGVPALLVNNQGAANNILELRANATPVWYVYYDATWQDVGAATHNALHTFTSGFVSNSSAQVNAATAVATATPAFYINNTGAGNTIFEARKAATPVFTIYNDATWADTGAATHSALHTFSAGFVSNNASSVNVATAVATQTPGFIVNNTGAGNTNFEVRKLATPVFVVNNAGLVVGYVLQYGSSGQKIVCGQTTFTGTGTLPTTLSTPTYVQVSLAQDATGDCAHVTYANASATVTAKCWDTALTPAAAQAPAVVDWCAIGTP